MTYQYPKQPQLQSNQKVPNTSIPANSTQDPVLDNAAQSPLTPSTTSQYNTTTTTTTKNNDHNYNNNHNDATNDNYQNQYYSTVPTTTTPPRTNDQNSYYYNTNDYINNNNHNNNNNNNAQNNNNDSNNNNNFSNHHNEDESLQYDTIYHFNRLPARLPKSGFVLCGYQWSLSGEELLIPSLCSLTVLVISSIVTILTIVHLFTHFMNNDAVLEQCAYIENEMWLMVLCTSILFIIHIGQTFLMLWTSCTNSMFVPTNRLKYAIITRILFAILSAIATVITSGFFSKMFTNSKSCLSSSYPVLDELPEDIIHNINLTRIWVSVLFTLQVAQSLVLVIFTLCLCITSCSKYRKRSTQSEQDKFRSSVQKKWLKRISMLFCCYKGKQSADGQKSTNDDLGVLYEKLANVFTEYFSIDANNNDIIVQDGDDDDGGDDNDAGYAMISTSFSPQPANFHGKNKTVLHLGGDDDIVDGYNNNNDNNITNSTTPTNTLSPQQRIHNRIQRRRAESNKLKVRDTINDDDHYTITASDIAIGMILVQAAQKQSQLLGHQTLIAAKVDRWNHTRTILNTTLPLSQILKQLSQQQQQQQFRQRQKNLSLFSNHDDNNNNKNTTTTNNNNNNTQTNDPHDNEIYDNLANIHHTDSLEALNVLGALPHHLNTTLPNFNPQDQHDTTTSQSQQQQQQQQQQEQRQLSAPTSNVPNITNPRSNSSHRISISQSANCLPTSQSMHSIDLSLKGTNIINTISNMCENTHELIDTSFIPAASPEHHDILNTSPYKGQAPSHYSHRRNRSMVTSNDHDGDDNHTETLTSLPLPSGVSFPFGHNNNNNKNKNVKYTTHTTQTSNPQSVTLDFDANNDQEYHDTISHRSLRTPACYHNSEFNHHHYHHLHLNNDHSARPEPSNTPNTKPLTGSPQHGPSYTPKSHPHPNHNHENNMTPLHKPADYDLDEEYQHQYDIYKGGVDIRNTHQQYTHVMKGVVNSNHLNHPHHNHNQPPNQIDRFTLSPNKPPQPSSRINLQSDNPTLLQPPTTIVMSQPNIIPVISTVNNLKNTPQQQPQQQQQHMPTTPSNNTTVTPASTTYHNLRIASDNDNNNNNNNIVNTTLSPIQPVSNSNARSPILSPEILSHNDGLIISNKSSKSPYVTDQVLLDHGHDQNLIKTILKGYQPDLPLDDWARLSLAKYYSRYAQAAYGWALHVWDHCLDATFCCTILSCSCGRPDSCLRCGDVYPRGMLENSGCCGGYCCNANVKVFNKRVMPDERYDDALQKSSSTHRFGNGKHTTTHNEHPTMNPNYGRSVSNNALNMPNNNSIKKTNRSNKRVCAHGHCKMPLQHKQLQHCNRWDREATFNPQNSQHNYDNNQQQSPYTPLTTPPSSPGNGNFNFDNNTSPMHGPTSPPLLLDLNENNPLSINSEQLNTSTSSTHNEADSIITIEQCHIPNPQSKQQQQLPHVDKTNNNNNNNNNKNKNNNNNIFSITSDIKTPQHSINYCDHGPRVQILHVNSDSDYGECTYYVAMDFLTKQVVVSIRGTMSLADTITDLDTELVYLPFAPQYYGHKGIYMAAEWLLRQLNGESGFNLHHFIANYRHIYDIQGIVVCGHSLGGGVSSILVSMLSQQYMDVLAICYAPPPALCPELSDRLHNKIISVTHHNDLIPRLSIAALFKLKQQMLNAFKVSISNRIEIMSFVNSKQFSKVFDQELIPHYHFSHGFTYDTLVCETDNKSFDVENNINNINNNNNNNTITPYSHANIQIGNNGTNVIVQVSSLSPPKSTHVQSNNDNHGQSTSSDVESDGELPLSQLRHTSSGQFDHHDLAMHTSTVKNDDNDDNLLSPISEATNVTQKTQNNNDIDTGDDITTQTTTIPLSEIKHIEHKFAPNSTPVHTLPPSALMLSPDQQREHFERQSLNDDQNYTPLFFDHTNTNLINGSQQQQLQQQQQQQPNYHYATQTELINNYIQTGQLQPVGTLTKLMKLQVPGRIYHFIPRERTIARRELNRKFRQQQRDEINQQKRHDALINNILSSNNHTPSPKNEQNKSDTTTAAISPLQRREAIVMNNKRNKPINNGVNNNSNSTNNHNLSHIAIEEESNYTSNKKTIKNSSSRLGNYYGDGQALDGSIDDSEDEDDDDDDYYIEPKGCQAVWFLFLSLITCFLYQPKLRKRINYDDNNNNNNIHDYNHDNDCYSQNTPQDKTLTTFAIATQHPSQLNKHCKYLVFPAHYSMYEEMVVSKSMWADHMPIHYDLTPSKLFTIPYDFLRIKNHYRENNNVFAHNLTNQCKH